MAFAKVKTEPGGQRIVGTTMGGKLKNDSVVPIFRGRS
ncbi:hypothetical protein Poly59_31670 [Rubripirellula reticaptiva]|uniref:Uncharacterized protein n=1 Tax=Rubripirellula reticaptiva TaxID=2528013 RepID=A0A5C6ET66_9BACT|nr:hypothetical protein Poly59_31670 [Rubripirellula reticaptiva]